MTKRIYVVNDTGAGAATTFLVNAGSASQAIRHVVKDRYTAEVVKTHQLAKLIVAGVKVQEAGSDE